MVYQLPPVQRKKTKNTEWNQGAIRIRRWNQTEYYPLSRVEERCTQELRLLPVGNASKKVLPKAGMGGSMGSGSTWASQSQELERPEATLLPVLSGCPKVCLATASED